MVDITVTGTVKRRQVLTRRGARPGDELYLSGTIGAAAAGLALLKRSTTVESLDVESCIQRYLRPEPRIRLGLMLARNRAASACMDLSDGLSDAVHQIADASRVGARIDAATLPIEPGARRVFEARGLDAVAEAIAGGDDYEMLVAVRPRARGRLAAAARHGGVALTRIGVCTEARAVVLVGAAAEAPLSHGGYQHFRSA
jgi:thiamine-monophosphate kinase